MEVERYLKDGFVRRQPLLDVTGDGMEVVAPIGRRRARRYARISTRIAIRDEPCKVV
jgi:hypothetical protein